MTKHNQPQPAYSQYFRCGRKEILQWMVIFLLLTSGCSSPIPTDPQTTPVHTPIFITPSPSPTRGTAPDQTPTSGITPVAPVPSPTATTTHRSVTRAPSGTRTPTPLPTLSPAARLQFASLEIFHTLPAPGLYSGTVVLGGYNDEPSYYLDLSTGVWTQIRGNTLFETVSPDHTRLAYVDWSRDDEAEEWLVIENKQTAPLYIPRQKNWRGLSWVDDRNLMIFAEPDYILINTLTQGQMVLDFPDLGQGCGVSAGLWDPVINPALDSAVYPACVGDQTGHIVLWDMTARQPVRYLKSENDRYGRQPVWSPDGQKFAIALTKRGPQSGDLASELYLVSNDGNQTQVTNLSAYYSRFLSVRDYQWSATGEQIAFTYVYAWGEDVIGAHLAVVDLVTLQVTAFDFDAKTPVWSPDGNQLIVYGEAGSDYATLLVDLDQKRAYVLGGAYRIGGWMK